MNAKDFLIYRTQNQKNVISVEGGFNRDTNIIGEYTLYDLYSLKAKFDTALSHFIDEVKTECRFDYNYYKLIAEVTVCWHHCYKSINPYYKETNKYSPEYTKEFYEELKKLDTLEYSTDCRTCNVLLLIPIYNNNKSYKTKFLTENMFVFIISKVNEVVADTLSDGSTVQNINDLNVFFNQAIPCWEYMKKTPNVFAPVSI